MAERRLRAALSTVVGVGLIAGAALAAGGAPLGDGTALIPGATGIATPSQGWLDAFADL